MGRIRDLIALPSRRPRGDLYEIEIALERTAVMAQLGPAEISELSLPTAPFQTFSDLADAQPKLDA